METFKGKVRFISETQTVTLRNRNRDKVIKAVEMNFDPEGHLVEERYRKRKHINRIAYTYNKKGYCIERREYDFDRVLFFRYKFKYDKWGNRTEEQCFNPDGTLSESRSSRFNKHGNELEKRIRRGETLDKLGFKYDDQGRVVEEIRYENGKFVQRNNYCYDAHGSKTEETYLMPDGQVLRQSYSYSYNAQDQITEEVVMDQNGCEIGRYSFSYDNEGRRTQRCYYDPNGHFNGSNITRNNQGLPTEEVWFSSKDGSCGRTLCTYDEAGNKTSEAVFHGTLKSKTQQVLLSDGTLTCQVAYAYDTPVCDYRFEFQHNANGTLRRREERHFNVDGKETIFIRQEYDADGNLTEEIQDSSRNCYRYDAQGNWTRKEHYENNALTDTTVRTIEYYDE